MSFKHMGIFPEQATKGFYKKPYRGCRQTCFYIKSLRLHRTSTIAALKSGASVCHVDSSRPAIASAKENLLLNSLRRLPSGGYLTTAGSLFREVRRGNKYDAVIMDPPGFGRGKILKSGVSRMSFFLL